MFKRNLHPHTRSNKGTGPNQCIAETTVQSERKTFHVGRYENPRGAYLRITEVSNGYSNSIVIPLSGVADVIGALDAMLQQSPDSKV